MSLSLAQLLAPWVSAPDILISGVESDSRLITPGDVFLAAQGQGSHGLHYLQTALDNGASAVVWEPTTGVATPHDLPVPDVALPGLSHKIGSIAAAALQHPAQRLFTVGVTGTDGKTSTAYLIAQVLDAIAVPCGYLGTIGYGRVADLQSASHTTPDPIRIQALLAEFVASGVSACAMEVSSHALDQSRVSGIGFDVAILTNVTRDHLDYHGTVERYATAKKRLFTDFCRGTAVINADDPQGASWLQERSVQGLSTWSYGLSPVVLSNSHYLQACDVQLSATGLRFVVHSHLGQAEVHSALLGRFNVYNLLATLAAVLIKGVTLPDAVAVLAVVHTVPGRMEGFRSAQARYPLVVVDYAHTPEALQQILTATRAHTQGKLWCVFGCGGDRDRGKRPLMGRAAHALADQVIITDDNPRSESAATIVGEILAGMPSDQASVQVIHDRAQAIRAAIHQAGPDDVVVIAGKGHETTQTYGTEVRAFSDRSFVAAVLAESQS